MPNHLQSQAAILDYMTGAFATLAARLEGDDWLAKLATETSNAYWMLGHITVYRWRILRDIGGRDTQPDWAEQFLIGTPCPTKLNPDPSDVLDSMHAAGPLLSERMVQLSPEELARESGKPIRSGDTTVEGMLQFIIFHEGYHLGQMGLIVKGLGKKPLVTPSK